MERERERDDMNVTKSKSGSYVCNHKEFHMYVIANKTKDGKGAYVQVQSPSRFKTVSYDGASILGAVEQKLRDSFNQGPLVDALRAIHAKIMEDLGLEYDDFII